MAVPKKIGEEKLGVEDFDTLLKSVESGDVEIPSTESLISEQDSTLMSSIRVITDKYNDPEWVGNIPLLVIQADIVLLQTKLVILSNSLSKFVSIQSFVEEFIKTERSKTRVKLKSARAKLAKITLEDIKDISYTTTGQILNTYMKYSMVAEMYKSLYYSTRDLIHLLDNAVARLAKLEPVQ